MEPTIAEVPDSELEDTEEDSTEDHPEPDIEEVELTEEDFGGDDLFADIEDADSSPTSEASDDTDPFDELGGGAGQLEVAFNDGASRLAVVGLDEKDELEAEFQEVFKAFQLGYFGSQFAQEYVLVDADDDIDPAWGLFGSAICCLTITLWMRPDGEEQLEQFQMAMQSILGGVDA